MGKCKVKAFNDFTIVHNSLFRDGNLSYKAKGILCHILSLPDDWDYTISGLVATGYTKESQDAIKSGIRELEEAGYVMRERRRNADGTLGGMEYTFSGFPEFKKDSTAKEISAETGSFASDTATPKNAINNMFLPTAENPLQAQKTESFCKKTLEAKLPTKEKPIVEIPAVENPLQVLSNTSTEVSKQSTEIKEKEIYKEKEKTDRLTDTCAHVREEAVKEEYEQTSLLDEEEETVKVTLVDVIKKQITYEELAADVELRKLYASDTEMKSVLDMVVQIMTRAAKAKVTKVCGVKHSRDVIVSQFLRRVDKVYVKRFLLHIAKLDTLSITTPLKYWSSVFFNFGVEKRKIGKSSPSKQETSSSSATKAGSAPQSKAKNETEEAAEETLSDTELLALYEQGAATTLTPADKRRLSIILHDLDVKEIEPEIIEYEAITGGEFSREEVIVLSDMLFSVYWRGEDFTERCRLLKEQYNVLNSRLGRDVEKPRRLAYLKKLLNLEQERLRSEYNSQYEFLGG